MERHTLPYSQKTIDMARIAKLYIERKYSAYFTEQRAKRSALAAMGQLHLAPQSRQSIKQQLQTRQAEKLRQKRTGIKIEDFKVVAMIGRGAFGEVYACRQKSSNRLLAIKKMAKKHMIARNQQQHAVAERNLMADSRSPWITSLHCSFQDSENLYLAMQFLQGGDLMNRLIKQEVFRQREARFYAAELVLAIEDVHRLGYIHRDIKPDNVLIDLEGHVKLSDFGLCKFACQAHLKQSIPRKQPMLQAGPAKSQQDRRKRLFSMVGTPDYIAPEVISKATYTQAVAWWALGIILYEMLVGYPPFNEEDPTVTCKKIVQWKKHLTFPEQVTLSQAAIDLIRKLITDQKNRITASSIKNHQFFKGVLWRKEALSPVFLPDKAELFANFDNFGTHQLQLKSGIKRNHSLDKFFIGYTYKQGLIETPPSNRAAQCFQKKPKGQASKLRPASSNRNIKKIVRLQKAKM